MIDNEGNMLFPLLFPIHFTIQKSPKRILFELVAFPFGTMSGGWTR